MQIAQVVPKTRTKKEDVFDYAIPPELLPMIKVGVLTEIPFHGRLLEGIVIDLKRSSVHSDLSAIGSIIYPLPVIDDIHIQLARWMSDYYLTPLSKTIFEGIAPPAKRSIRKLDHTKY